MLYKHLFLEIICWQYLWDFNNITLWWQLNRCFEYEHTSWILFQKRVVYTKLDIYVFIILAIIIRNVKILTGQIAKTLHYNHMTDIHINDLWMLNYVTVIPGVISTYNTYYVSCWPAPCLGKSILVILPLCMISTS